jgi:hypothetical protein
MINIFGKAAMTSDQKKGIRAVCELCCNLDKLPFIVSHRNRLHDHIRNRARSKATMVPLFVSPFLFKDLCRDLALKL